MSVINSLFVGSNVRRALAEGQGDYVPIFLSEVPNLFRSEILPLDIAMIQVSPPDKHGFCSLGVAVDCTLAAVQSADHVIAQVNPQMPRTHGDGFLHVKQIDALVEHDAPIASIPVPPPSPEEKAIGNSVASLMIDNTSSISSGDKSYD